MTTAAPPAIGTALLYLGHDDVVALAGDGGVFVDAVREALVAHAAGRFVQPLKPYLRWRGEQNHIADRIIAMPGYVRGDTEAVGIKWVGSKHDNPARGLDRASALVVLNDPETHYPIAVLSGGYISAMRTAAVTALAAEHLAKRDAGSVTCIGCGPIGQHQLGTLLPRFPSLADVHLFDFDRERARAFGSELAGRFGVRFTVHDSARSAVGAGEIVITATTADRPYIPYAWLRPGAFVSNVSIMDLEKDVFLQADKVIVDDWDQANREKKTINQLVLEGRFSREMLYAELGEIVSGAKPGRERDDEIVVLNPMGMAIEDIACAHAIYRKAVAGGAGTLLPV